MLPQVRVAYAMQTCRGDRKAEHDRALFGQWRLRQVRVAYAMQICRGDRKADHDRVLFGNGGCDKFASRTRCRFVAGTTRRSMIGCFWGMEAATSPRRVRDANLSRGPQGGA